MHPMPKVRLPNRAHPAWMAWELEITHPVKSRPWRWGVALKHYPTGQIFGLHPDVAPYHRHTIHGIVISDRPEGDDGWRYVEFNTKPPSVRGAKVAYYLTDAAGRRILQACGIIHDSLPD